jgi:nucleoside-diphosphate-sugar epimerase
LEEAHEHGDFPVTIIRPAHTYGEGRGLIHSFGLGGAYYFNRIRYGKPIITHGDGSSLWAACHRDDVGQAFAEAVGNAKAFGKGYHTASEEPMTWNQYHQTVAQAMNAPEPDLIHIPTDFLFEIAPKEAEWCKENFQYNNIFDNAAAKADLNFRYTVPLLTECVALSRGLMIANVFTIETNPISTAKLSRNGSTSVRKRLFSECLIAQRRKCSILFFISSKT